MILFAVFWQVLNCSAYCHTGNPTASGVMPEVGMAAADHLPFGAKVTLPVVNTKAKGMKAKKAKKEKKNFFKKLFAGAEE